jgi:hypothetical protein
MNNRTMEVVMLDMARQASVRDERGRFVPGMSGNPAGKLPGTRNRATVLRAALDSAEGPAMARIVIVRRRGDGEVLRCAADAAAAQPGDRDRSALWGAAGEITPDEAVQVTRVLDGRRKAIEAAWREAERTAPPSHLKPSPNLKPSPSGRGLGEGAGRVSNFAGKASSRRPHPDPLPRGEGTRLGGRWVFGDRVNRANLLHSTCNSRSCWVPGVPVPVFLGGGERRVDSAI